MDKRIRRNIKGYSEWISINIGDYIVKTSWGYSIEKRVIQVAEANVVVDIFIKRLAHKDGNVRLRAAEGLNRITKLTKDAVPALAKVLVSAVPALIEALSNEDEWVRSYAAYALGRIGEPAKGAVPALIEALRDKDVAVCLSVVEALYKIGTPEALKAVKEMDG